MEVRPRLLRASLLFKRRERFLFADGVEARAPLAIYTVEEENVIAGLQSQHGSEVMRLVCLKHDPGPGTHRGLDE